MIEWAPFKQQHSCRVYVLDRRARDLGIRIAMNYLIYSMTH